MEKIKSNQSPFAQGLWRTVSGRNANYIFTSTGNAPVVMGIGSGMENYTTEGKHLFDPSLDLVKVEPINYNLPPTGDFKDIPVGNPSKPFSHQLL